MQLTITVDDSQVKKTLSGILSGVKNFREPLDDTGDKLLVYFGEDVFITQGAALVGAWRQLAESTLRARAARRGYYAAPPMVTGKILIWTGRLKKGYKKETKRDSLRVFNDVDYAKYHQKAGGSPPQRKLIAITPQVFTILLKSFQEYIDKLIKTV